MQRVHGSGRLQLEGVSREAAQAALDEAGGHVGKALNLLSHRPATDG